MVIVSEPVYPCRLDETVAIVTGSTQGIGAGVAKRRAAEGATVVETIHNNGGRATFIPAEMRQPDEIEQLIALTVTGYGTIYNSRQQRRCPDRDDARGPAVRARN